MNMPAMLNNPVQKESLQAYKDKLLTEIFYYNKRIEESRNEVIKTDHVDEASSDSDSDLSVLVDTGPPLPKLKKQQAMLKTCLQATQELTNLEVLQSEVNVLLQEPVLEGEPPLNGTGTWREVTAECCVDLVPFNITFYAHQEDGKFSPVSYRGLRVMPLKRMHEAELVKSVLPGLKRPSDAVEVLRSYALAHRSRRSTLARLADKFGEALFMEPMENGGYQLKCANLLEVSWTLQNKWSPVAPFHHRLKFDIEYMEKSYIKAITAAHRQLSDPSVDTDERLHLLAKIINICLAARPLEPEAFDPEELSPVRAEPQGRRTTLDQEPELPDVNKNKDSEVMAPPKSLPKKIKPKSNSPGNKSADSKTSKRSIQDDKINYNAKRPKIDANNQNDPRNKETASTNDSDPKTAKSDKFNERSVSDTKIKKDKINANSKSDGDKVNTDAVRTSNDVVENSDYAKDANNKDSNKDNIDKKKVDSKIENNKKIINKNAFAKRKSLSNVKSKEKHIKAKALRNSAPINKKVANDKKDLDKNIKKNENSDNAKKTEATDTVLKKSGVIEIVKNITNEKGDFVKKVVKKLASDKPKVVEKIGSNVPKTNIPVEAKLTKKVDSKSSTNNTEQAKKPLNEQNIKISKSASQNVVKNDFKKIPKVFTAKSGFIKKNTTTGTAQKENTAQNKINSSKIPQKNIGMPKAVKKIAVRVSPRKSITKSKPPQAGVNLKKIVQKPISGIPRLLTKPKPKVM